MHPGAIGSCAIPHGGLYACNVADMCVKLAEIYGEDVKKAYTAGILHDCRKEAEADVQRSEMMASGYYVDPAELDSKSTWHGIAGAYYVHEKMMESKKVDVLKQKTLNIPCIFVEI